ncbi:hypothetical protein GGX14DRAFT_445075 [Mycena pura]|uniref:Uncharacterized protein n=1 Tax=Mycena pura TaxID=153505 RepID=A0AAD6YH45_9AGAR|nr:hypothetical protein GGX14DRAFT_445075 [Mycena pura]
MKALAPELIDSIVCGLDVPSLKACSLAGSLARAPCQRILLRSLSVRVADGPLRYQPSRPVNHIAARDLLIQSPHVAHYITHLKVQFLSVTVDTAAADILEELLAKLSSVRYCTLRAGDTVNSGSFNWADILPATFTDFLSHQQLEKLWVDRIAAIPLPIFSQMLGATRFLSMIYVSLDALEDHTRSITLYQPRIETLLLNSKCDRVAEQLCCPPFRSYMTILRHLSVVVWASDDLHGPFLSSLPRTLRSIRFSFKVLYTTPRLILPNLSLPEVVTAEFALPLGKIRPGYMNPIVSFLAPGVAPVLGDIIIANRYSICMNWIFPPSELAALDSALEAHPGSPRVRLRVAFFQDEALQKFLSCTQAGMPRAHQAGRLFIEQERFPH